MTTECRGHGGYIEKRDGYGYAGGFEARVPCNRCGGWHDSPSERELDRRIAEARARHSARRMTLRRAITHLIRTWN